jgi:sulfur carrier protein
MNALTPINHSLTRAGIRITVNGESHTLRENTSLAELLVRLGHMHDSLATAVNGDFVPRSSRMERLLLDGDAVTCFQPIVGG